MTDEEARRMGANALRYMARMMIEEVPRVLTCTTPADYEALEKVKLAARILTPPDPVPAPATPPSTKRAVNLDG